jgi:hypothetical protein
VVPVAPAAPIAAYFPAGIPAEKGNMRQSCLSGFKPDQSPNMRLWGCRDRATNSPTVSVRFVKLLNKGKNGRVREK